MKPFTQRVTRLFNFFVIMIVAFVGALLILMFKIKTTPPPACATTDQETYSVGCIPTPSFTGGERVLYTYGKTLFNNNCQQCHSAGADVIVGPGLKGILDRRSIEWLIPWI